MFGAELLPKVLSGEKTVTRRRLGWPNPQYYRVGRTYVVNPGRGRKHVGHIDVWDVRTEPLGAITDEDARREGFESVAAFVSYWARMHGSHACSETIARIEFELAPFCTSCAPVPEGADA